MARRSSKMKQEPTEATTNGSSLPTPESSQPSCPQQYHLQPSFDMPVRAGSVTASITPTVVGDTTVGNTNSTSADTEMTDVSPPGRDAMVVMGEQSRQLIQAIQKLEALNIKSTLPSLPIFVVIGDQSAGKSSIIEAACDITLPRNSGTCTRCPFKITTTASKNSEPWTCKITLHKEYYWQPGCRVGPHSTFDNWVDQDRSVLEFDEITNKDELGVALQRAQLAVLNPDKNHREFVHKSLDSQAGQDKQRVGFSPNIISLEITAPGLPELSFYDLPGAINTMGDESQQYLVDFVEALLKSYISNEKAYILLACSANQDLENSTSFRFLRQCKATPRSMGILTKPDLLELTQNSVQNLRGLLQGGKDYRVGDGWFITRQLSQAELNREDITHQGARQIEAAFFANDPWATELAPFTHRFGIPNLSSAISRKLTAHILNDLPEIVQRVQSRLNVVDKRLASFPEQAAVPTMVVLTEIERVKTAINAEVNADSLTSAFRTPYREVFREFAKKLQALKPVVVLSTPGYQKKSISLSSDEEEESPSKSRRTSGGGRAMSMAPNMTPSSASKRARRTPASSSSESAMASKAKTVFRLDEAKGKFDSAPGADIPGQASDAVTRSLVRETMSGWSEITESVVKRIRAIFERMLDATTNYALPQYNNTELMRRTKEVVFALLDDLIKVVDDTVANLVAAETLRPITYGTETMKNKRSAYEAKLRQGRNDHRVDEYYDDLDSQGYKVPSKPDQKKKTDEVITKLGADDYDREVKALATPLAYYDIASAQLVDSIAKQFEYGLMSAFEGRLFTKLFRDLGAEDVQKCAELLAEDPATERRRAELSAEKIKLEQALAELNSLPRMHA